ncbi:ETX/MTX2 family pore-forming toxin [Elizabethkingia meningoseptica]|uniref:ETX/MTX2 family pore-forming toxin n=2 Tax=Elizabethkingia meningoseptica TaxID=238 RepID=UPI0023B1949A|nr:ETX/MTX2 family pore-forming toxin [Elizabethkingia meningoseptica]MDE5432277.1 ETX/MTX2 family pore-forming toxin [Elizabethkingia meningoseptica]MDE5439111.1 ETX/MTX2 family pore-forming toxin [Elizabethkingia meningoseptica]MDE5468688.1 ETX/MTX2 family pore-forming toxin [Elizabethkingia meningoseptica]MDE5476000.1 ETX/MTX2 family pore-forming toxin [Elizabethkingia meningoseptica]MDE5478935.1 ETX/MTX2 family pore-forming toxin [Elizabethkingia meningoseptica]
MKKIICTLCLATILALFSSCSREDEIKDNKIDIQALASISGMSGNFIEDRSNSFLELKDYPVNIISKENINGNFYLTAQGANRNATFEKQNNSDAQKFYLEFPAEAAGGISIYTFINGQKHVLTTGVNAATNSLIPKIPDTAFRGTFWKFLGGSTIHPESYILQNTGIRYRDNGVTTYGVIGNSDASKIFVDKYLNQGKQEFEIRPIDDFEIISLEYDNPENGTMIKQPDFITTWFYSNNTSVQQSMTTAFSKRASFSSNWSKSTGGSLNVNTTVKTGIPIIAEGKITTTVNTNYSATYGKNETMEDSQTYNFPIVIAPRTSVTATATVGRYLINLNYTAKLRGKNTGKLITLKGTWNGVSCTDIKVTLEQRNLDTNSVISAKVLNDVPKTPYKL